MRYDRNDIAKLVPINQADLADDLASRALLLDRLHVAVRAERAHQLTGHWSYVPARHWAIARAYKAEVEAAAYMAKIALLSMEGARPAWANTIQSHAEGLELAKQRTVNAAELVKVFLKEIEDRKAAVNA